MLKKMKIMVLAGLILLMISGAAFARGGHNRSEYRSHSGNRHSRPAYRCDYRPVYHHRDYRPMYRPVYYRYGYGYCRPVYVYPSSSIIVGGNGFIFSTSSFFLGIGF